jgi:tRNA 2-selenouridine synthase
LQDLDPSKLEALAKQSLNEIWLALPMGDGSQMRMVMEHLQMSTATIRFVPDWFSFRLINHGVSEVLGMQMIDLEGLAGHRGSLFGHTAGGQPSQKAFECALAMELSRLDPKRPVVVEAESAKVGNLRLPPQLWAAMGKAPRVAIEATLPERARYLSRAYADIVADEARLLSVIGLLAHAHSEETISSWATFALSGQFEALAHELMERHYDPRYEKHRARMAHAQEVILAPSLTEADLPALADQVAAAVTRLALP